MFPDMFEIFKDDKEESAAEGTPSVEPSRIFSLSVGGSILVGDKPAATQISKFSESINKLLSEGYKFALVVGGGKVCRSYQATARALGANNFFLDEIGVKVTRINALLFTQTIDNAFPKVVCSVAKAKELLGQGKTPVLGGLMPGFTTDAVAALVAEAAQATFVNLSNVDGVYSADPRKTSNARFYPELSYERLVSIIHLAESRPGQNVVLDLPAALILKRSKIKAIFLNGTNLSNFEAAIRGEEFKGTIVSEAISEREAKATGKRLARKTQSMDEEEQEKEINPEEIEL